MKYRVINHRLTTSVILASWLWTTRSNGADDAIQSRVDGQTIRAEAGLYPIIAHAEQQAAEDKRQKRNLDESIRTAAEYIRDVEGHAAKSAAQQDLVHLLDKYFEIDMVQREKEIGSIQDRLTRLRELVDRRRAQKQEIIELQTKLALNEVERLGFYDSEPLGKLGSFRSSLPLSSGFDLPSLAAPPKIAAPAIPTAPAAARD
jgi:hypothetical protein